MGQLQLALAGCLGGLSSLPCVPAGATSRRRNSLPKDATNAPLPVLTEAAPQPAEEGTKAPVSKQAKTAAEHSNLPESAQGQRIGESG